MPTEENVETPIEKEKAAALSEEEAAVEPKTSEVEPEKVVETISEETVIPELVEVETVELLVETSTVQTEIKIEKKEVEATAWVDSTLFPELDGYVEVFFRNGEKTRVSSAEFIAKGYPLPA